MSSFVIDKVGSGRWRAPPSGLPVRRRRRPRGLQRGDRAPYLGYWGLPRVPFLKPGDVCTKNMPEGGGLLSVGGEIICASARECSFFCVTTDVSLGTPGLLSRPWSMGNLKKGLPHARFGGFPRLILSLPVVRTRGRGLNTLTGRAQPAAFQQICQGPNQAAALVERIAVERQNCSEY